MVLAGDVFDVPIRKDIIHRVVRWQLAKRQQVISTIILESMWFYGINGIVIELYVWREQKCKGTLKPKLRRKEGEGLGGVIYGNWVI